MTPRSRPPSRFIPTRVGNTSVRGSWDEKFTVHPHACGEYWKKVKTRWARCGSSPRVWGIQVLILTGEHWYRFIPTRVGNTLHRGPTRRTDPVHPHACGEYDLGVLVGNRCRGSSPRVWGIQGDAGLYLLWRRFIPTRVGNTSRP